MSLDLLLLAVGGIFALLGGGLVFALSPGRYPSLVAALALASLGLLQFGWARALSDIGPMGAPWFELSLASSLPVALFWVVLSRTIGLGPGPAPLGVWRYYVMLQGLFAAAALFFVTMVPAGGEIVAPRGMPGYLLRPVSSAMLFANLLNLVLITASFESTYFALSRHARRAFLPGLAGILIAAGAFTYVTVTSLVAGRISAADLSLGGLPTACVALLLPVSLIRGRLGEVAVRREKPPLTRTASITVTIGFLVVITTLLSIARTTGWSLARSIWVLVALGGSLGMVAFAFSNRFQRRVQRVIDPYLVGRSGDHRTVAARTEEWLRGATTVPELCHAIPAHSREILGMEPVTLFVLAEDGSYRTASSTIEPLPEVVIQADDPLAVALRDGHSIRLRGRFDDLEFIPIYVENATQLDACAATYAAPIIHDDEMLGFILSGEGKDPEATRYVLRLLDTVCRRYADRIWAIEKAKSRIRLSGFSEITRR